MLVIPTYIGLWLLQIFFILFPMLTYQSFFQKKLMKKSRQKVILSILCGISIIICMTFPVSINENFLLDFRFIPLIIGFIYGGYRVGFFLSILLISFFYANVHQVGLDYLSTAGDDVLIKGDRTMVRFALINLIKNAIEACEPKGCVSICLHEMLSEIYIVIEDNGAGIPSSVLNQLGRPLPTTKANGTGLGLVSTYKIAESMGGRVEVESKPNEGTRFNLYFPKLAKEKNMAVLSAFSHWNQNNFKIND